MNVDVNKLYHLIDVDNKCDTCRHCTVSKILDGDVILHVCNLTHVLMKNNYACGLYDSSMKGEKICYNCEHFLGGSDWGLSCAKDYYKLTGALDEVCESFIERKIEEDVIDGQE